MREGHQAEAVVQQPCGEDTQDPLAALGGKGFRGRAGSVEAGRERGPLAVGFALSQKPHPVLR